MNSSEIGCNSFFTFAKAQAEPLIRWNAANTDTISDYNYVLIVTRLSDIDIMSNRIRLCSSGGNSHRADAIRLKIYGDDYLHVGRMTQCWDWKFRYEIVWVELILKMKRATEINSSSLQ